MSKVDPNVVFDFKKLEIGKTKAFLDVGGKNVSVGGVKSTEGIVLKGTEYSAEYAKKIKDTYLIFKNNGYEVSEHGLNRILGRINQGKIGSVDEVVDALQTGTIYSDTVNGGTVIFKDGISINIAKMVL